MDKILILQEMRQHLDKLQMEMSTLEENTRQLSDVIARNMFIPHEIGERVKESLKTIADTQMECRKSYMLLESEAEFPQTIAEAYESLRLSENVMEQKQKFIRVVSKFMRLHSADSEVERILSSHKEELQQLTNIIADMEIDVCHERIGMYVDLLNAYEENDQTKVVASISMLLDNFDKRLVAAMFLEKSVYMVDDEKGEGERIKEPEKLNIICSEEVAISSEESDAGKEAAGALPSDYSKIFIPQYIYEKEIKITKSPREDKKFSSKEFKREIANADRFVRTAIFRTARMHRAFTAEFISKIEECDVKAVENTLEHLINRGYLRKYSIDKLDQFYRLSNRGIKILSSKTACIQLGVRCNDVTYEAVQESVPAVLMQIAYVRILERVSGIRHMKVFHAKDIISANGFIIEVTEEVKNNCDVYIGAFPLEQTGCVEYYEAIEEYLLEAEEITRVVFVGADKAHAKNQTEWMFSRFPELISEDAVYRYELIADKFYTGNSDEAIKPELIWKEDQNMDSSDKERFVQGEISALPEEELPVVTNSSEKTEKLTETSSQQESVEEAAEKEDDLSKVEKVAERECDLPKTEDTLEGGTVKRVPGETDTTGFSPEQEEQILDECQQMIVDDKAYCATVYLHVAAKKSARLANIYEQLAYAVNDPLAQCSYSSDKIMDLYTEDSRVSVDYYWISAVLRNYYLNHMEYDYSVKSLYGNVKNHKILAENSNLGNLVYELMLFKDNVHKGIDVYADYRSKERDDREGKLLKVCKSAREYYEQYIISPTVEKAAHKRYLETRRLIFAKNGELGEYLKIVANDDRSMLMVLLEFLCVNFIKEGTTVNYVNVDNSKVNLFMNEYWEEAGKNIRDGRKSSNLMSGLRNNLYSAVTKGVKILCEWAELVQNHTIGSDDRGIVEYKKIKLKLLEDIKAAYDRLAGTISGQNNDVDAGIKVLMSTLQDLKERLEGDYSETSNKFFYINFLKNEYVMLNGEYMPDIDAKTFLLDEYPFTERIRLHAEEQELKLEERLEQIFKNYGDDYGSARIIDTFIMERTKTAASVIEEKYNLEESVKFARQSAASRREFFIENLELAQSYGQIDNSTEDKKDKILSIVDRWYKYAEETSNYGFFSRGLDYFDKKIKAEAKVREEAIVQELNSFKERNPKWCDEGNLKKKINYIQTMLDEQNYTVAEDRLHRLNSGEPEGNITLFEEDYLKEFYEKYDYYYKKVSDSSKSLTAGKQEGIPLNKEQRGGREILENWSGSGHIGETRLKNLLNALGFEVESVKEQPKVGKAEHYNIMLMQSGNGKRANYTHPIAPFGSLAEEAGFKVACIFGKHSADDLTDWFREFGNAKHTIVLLDHALAMPERRHLARIAKAKASEKIFGVIDRTMIMYLAHHYSATSINRRVMSVMMPFAYYQPYVIESANVMPPEIFMGRKEELGKIESPVGVNIVYGGRQLGKSALLRMAKSNIDRNENGDRAVLVDIKGLNYEQAAVKIGHALYDEKILTEDTETCDWDELARMIKQRLMSQELDKIPYFLLLIDEADAFIESCEAINYRPFDALKDVQSVGRERFKFVIAGLRNIVKFKREVALGNNSVLTHLKSMTVTPFKVAEARELLEIPLYYLGLRFPKEKDSLIYLILASTNYFPGLIQLYCAKLIEAMKKSDYAGYNEVNTPPYEIEESHIKKVLADTGFRQQIQEKYEITLKLDEDNYYYIIALLIAHLYHQEGNSDGFAPKEVHNMGCEFEIAKIKNLSVSKVAALMDELCELNVLRTTSDNRYLYTRYSFFQMMGSSTKVEDEILNYMED